VNAILSTPFLFAVLLGALAALMPLLLAGIGELIGEESGVLNLGIEGVMLLGAFTAYAVALTTGQPWLGYLAALLVAVLATLPMLAAVAAGLNQIVVGLAVFLAGLGLTSVLHDAWFAAENARVNQGFPWLVPLTIALVVALSVWLRRSDAALRLRVAGLNPSALDLAGHSVTGTRVRASLFGGVMAGLGGAYLALDVVGSFTPGMTHGVGFLAIILVMLSTGRIGRLVTGAIAYGVIVSLGTASQLTSVAIPSDVIEIIPFVLVILVLLLARNSSTVSPNLGTDFAREAKA